MMEKAKIINKEGKAERGVRALKKRKTNKEFL
jgi:hypothetical protein